MTNEEFALLPLDQKWAHISDTMLHIQHMEVMYGLRRRFNPHHPDKHVEEEKIRMRMIQHEKWSYIKDLYAAHRDELANTLGSKPYEQCKDILEKIFTIEVDDALRNITK